MGRLLAYALLLCCVAGTLRAGDEPLQAVKDPFYGVVLFDYHQQNYFSAITHLRASQQHERMPHHADEAELLLGGLYLSYGMQKRAEEIFNQLLARQIDGALRNRVWLALAGIYHERGFDEQAQQLLSRIDGPLPQQQEDERLLLQSTLLLRQGRHGEAAQLLATYSRDSLERRYALYNLSMAHLRQGREAVGRALLIPLAQAPLEEDGESAALRDKANIALGYSYLRKEEFAQARPWFQQVRLHGPFASQALLGLGWVDAGLGNGSAALSAWLPLVARHPADPSVLEGLLAVPYTLNQLGGRQQAAAYYEKAIATYDTELKTLEGIVSGMNFVALAQELADSDTSPEAGWQWRADISGSSILGPYIYQAMAGHEFQEALRNYRDLLFLTRYLEQRQRDLDAYEAMLEQRQGGYEERLPQIEKSLARLDSAALTRQRDRLARQLAAIETAEDAGGLADGGETQLLAKVAEAEARLKRIGESPERAAAQRRLTALKGILIWRLETEYPARLWQVKSQLRQLDEALAQGQTQRESLRRAQEGAPRDFGRYRQTIAAARGQMEAMSGRAERLARSYEARLQQLTVAALQGMEARIREYQGQALFAVAQIYDYALHAQGEEP